MLAVSKEPKRFHLATALIIAVLSINATIANALPDGSIAINIGKFANTFQAPLNSKSTKCTYCIHPDLDFINPQSQIFIVQVRTMEKDPPLCTLKLSADGGNITPTTANTGKGNFRTAFDKNDVPFGKSIIKAQAIDDSGQIIGEADLYVKRTRYYISVDKIIQECDTCNDITTIPLIVDFENTIPASQVYASIIATNNTESDIFFTASSSQPWVVIQNGPQFSLQSGGSITIKFGINWNFAKPNQVVQSRITLYGKGIKHEFPIGATILADVPVCAKSLPQNIDFGYTPRGTSFTKKLILLGSPKFEMVCNDGWLKFDPKSTEEGREILVTINASLLPYGKSHNTKLVALPKGACQLVFVPISVSTDPSISVSLVTGSKQATINSKAFQLDSPAKIISSRVMVPLRFISDAFGASIVWNQKTKMIVITRLSKTITMKLGENTATVDGKQVNLDVAPTVIDGRTLVPIRAISDFFGATTGWNSQTKTAKIDWDPD